MRDVLLLSASVQSGQVFVLWSAQRDDYVSVLFCFDRLGLRQSEGGRKGGEGGRGRGAEGVACWRGRLNACFTRHQRDGYVSALPETTMLNGAPYAS